MTEKNSMNMSQEEESMIAAICDAVDFGCYDVAKQIWNNVPQPVSTDVLNMLKAKMGKGGFIPDKEEKTR